MKFILILLLGGTAPIDKKEKNATLPWQITGFNSGGAARKAFGCIQGYQVCMGGRFCDNVM